MKNKNPLFWLPFGTFEIAVEFFCSETIIVPRIFIPQVSVIIPTYNRPAELTNCIRSILDQSGKPAELIIVDDGNLAEPPFQKECTKKVQPVDFFHGYAMSFRKEIFQEFSFDEKNIRGMDCAKTRIFPAGFLKNISWLLPRGQSFYIWNQKRCVLTRSA